jgi:hypothetical protein
MSVAHRTGDWLVQSLSVLLLGVPAWLVLPCLRLAEFPFRERRDKNSALRVFCRFRHRKIASMSCNCVGYLKWSLFGLILCSATTLFAASDCFPIREAKQHVGETKCVTGKVLRVKAGARGVHFVDFCEDHMACPFTVVVFPHDLKDVGDGSPGRSSRFTVRLSFMMGALRSS